MTQIIEETLSLTRREKECLFWACQDKSVKETSSKLFVSPETVKKHRKSLLRKLGCHTMTGALHSAFCAGVKFFP